MLTHTAILFFQPRAQTASLTNSPAGNPCWQRVLALGIGFLPQWLAELAATRPSECNGELFAYGGAACVESAGHRIVSQESRL